MRFIVLVGIALLLLAGCGTEVPLVDAGGHDAGAGGGAGGRTGGGIGHGGSAGGSNGGGAGNGTGGTADGAGGGGVGGTGDLEEVIYQPDPGAPTCAMIEAAGSHCVDGWCSTQEGVQTNSLYDAWSSSPGHTWAVGAMGTILHWDGVRWTH